jgi:hypothetical protein
MLSGGIVAEQLQLVVAKRQEAMITTLENRIEF